MMMLRVDLLSIVSLFVLGFYSFFCWVSSQTELVSHKDFKDRAENVDCWLFISLLFILSCVWHLQRQFTEPLSADAAPPPLPLPWSQPNINLIRIRNWSAFSKAVTKFIPTNILPFVWLSSYIYIPPAGNPIRRILRKVNGETVKKLNDVQINLIHHLFHFSCFC